MTVSMTIAPFDRSLGNAGPRDVSPGRVVLHAVAEGSGQTGRRIPKTHWHSAFFGSQPRERVGIPPSSPHPYIVRVRRDDNRAPPGESRAQPCSTTSTTGRYWNWPAIFPGLAGLPHPDATATAHSKLCGSTVTIDLKMDGDTVTDFAHDVKACALGQASSSIMARHIVGANAQELRELREDVRRMLKENGPPPAAGRWADVALLEPVRDYKARHASTMLTFDAVVSAIDQIAAKRGEVAPASAPACRPAGTGQRFRASIRRSAPGGRAGRSPRAHCPLAPRFEPRKALGEADIADPDGGLRACRRSRSRGSSRPGRRRRSGGPSAPGQHGARDRFQLAARARCARKRAIFSSWA